MNSKRLLLALLIAPLFLLSCNDQPCIKEVVKYPDLISPIYYIDTFQISSPRIALVDSIPYIFSLEKLKAFENEQDFLRQKGVIRYLTPDLITFRYRNYLNIYDTNTWFKSFSSAVAVNKFYFDEMFLPDDSLGTIPIMKFTFEPEGFILTFISEIDSVIEGGDQIFEVLFTKDYELALAPIYKKRDLIKINELWYRKINDEELVWNWFEKLVYFNSFRFSRKRCR